MVKLTAVGPLTKAAEIATNITSTEFVVSVGMILYAAAAIVFGYGAFYVYRNWNKRNSGAVSASRSDLSGGSKDD